MALVPRNDGSGQLIETDAAAGGWRPSLPPITVSSGSTTHKWSAQSTATTVINGAAVAPTLKALANNANKLGAEFDNTLVGNRFQYADFELLCRGASAMTAGAVIKLWIVEAMDGTNYEDGGDSVTPARPADEQFYVQAVATQQRITLRNVVLPPSKWKPLIRNESGQALTNVDGENLLTMRTYTEVDA